MENLKPGKLFIVAAPSGAGKTTLVNEAIKRLAKDFSISKIMTYTTRPPRGNEVNDKDYHFLSVEEFNKKKNAHFFLETTEYDGKFYGSPTTFIQDMELGKSFVIVTDIPGAKHLSQLIRGAIRIWIEAPNNIELKRRLEKRGSLSPHQIEERTKLAKEEMKEAEKSRLFDYVVVNEVFEQTLEELMEIIKGKLKV